jgi:hypothetical protein
VVNSGPGAFARSFDSFHSDAYWPYFLELTRRFYKACWCERVAAGQTSRGGVCLGGAREGVLGTRAKTTVCCAGMAHVDASDGAGDVDERQRVGRKRKKQNTGDGNSTPRTAKHRRIKDAYARQANWRPYHSECPEIE